MSLARHILYRSGPVTWAIIDGLLALVVMLVAFFIGPYTNIALHPHHAMHMPLIQAVVAFVFIVMVSAHVLGLHDPLAPKTIWYAMARALGVACVAVVLLILYATFIRYERIGRYILFLVFLLLPLGMVTCRWLLWEKIQARIRLLVLSPEDPQLLRALIQSNHMFADIVLVTWDLNDLPAQCQAHRIDEVIYCSLSSPSPDCMNELMACQRRGIRISNLSTFSEKNFYRIPQEHIDGLWFLMTDIDHYHSIYRVLKRLMDIVVSCVGLIVVTPILGLVAIGVKLESPGTIFYSQMRLGRNGKLFRLWKVRTMRMDAEANGPQWAGVADNRITRLGRWLRKTRLDETPQFWNILRGDMSLVGPRPERPEMVQTIEKSVPYYQQRHLLKPGLTGWAQINYPYGASMEDAAQKLQFDLYYIKNVSLALDAQIILRTAGTIMKGSR